MKVSVTKDEVVLTEQSVISQGDYRVNECFFDLPQCFDGLNVTAIFNNIPVPVVQRKCIVPSLEIGNCVLGVYAYNKNDDDEIQVMYSPKPCVFFVNEGSYRSDVSDENTPTVSRFEEYCGNLSAYYEANLKEIGELIKDTESTKNKTSSINKFSTNEEYPTAKSVFDKINSMTSGFDVIFGGNLFNKNEERKNASELSDVTEFEGIIEGASFSYLGQLKINASAFITPLIPVKSGGVYTTVCATKLFGDTMMLAVYDKEKKFLGNISCVNTEDRSYFTEVTFDISKSTATPQNLDRNKIVYARAYYVKSTATVPYMEEYMFVEGADYPSQYLRYGEDIYSPKADIVYNPVSENPQSGKAVAEAIENLKQEINGAENEVEAPSLLMLPEKFNLVVGDTFELFYKGIVNVINSDDYDFEFQFSDGSNMGKAYKRKYTFTPSAGDVGEKTVTISLINNMGDIVDSKATVFNIIEPPSSPTENKVVLCIGDSLTQSGVWVNEFNRRLTGTDGVPTGLGLHNIQFTGSQNKAGTKYEGYGGWRYSHYLSANKSDGFMNIYGTFNKTDSDQHSVYKDSNNVQWKLETISDTKIKIIREGSSGTLPASGALTWMSGGSDTDNIVYTSSEQAPGNPFWNESTNENDFSLYAQKQGVSSIDYVYILLGWNSKGWSFENFENDCKSFIDGFLSAFPNCKIGLVGLQVPSRDGLAHNYGTKWSYYDTLQFVWRVQEFYIALAKESKYNGKIEYVNFAGQFDTDNSCPTVSMTVNTRSTLKEDVQVNGLHPAPGGYFQLADAVYRHFCTLI